jgi:hypothetical protein
LKPQQFLTLYTLTLKMERVHSICLQDYTMSQYEQSPQWKPRNLYQYNLCGDETSQGCVWKGRLEQIWQNTNILLYWRLMRCDFSRTEFADWYCLAFTASNNSRVWVTMQQIVNNS